MIELFDLLKDDPAVKCLDNNEEKLGTLNDIEESLIIATSFKNNPRMMVVIKNNNYTAQQLYNRLYPLLKNDVLFFGVEEYLRVEAVAASPANYANQMEVLSSLLIDEKPKIIITHPVGVMRYLPTKETFAKHILSLKVGMQCDMKEIRNLLLTSGYRQCARVDQPLTFSLRGGVIDVFSIQNDQPIRIEFFDDEIDSIRYFDIATQRTSKIVDEAIVMPASSQIYDEDFSLIREKVNNCLNKCQKSNDEMAELRENIESDLGYLENHIYEHYLYRYQCFYNENSSILDYLKNPQIIISTVEEINNNLELVFKENNDFITELYSNNEGLNYYSVFADFDRVLAKRNTFNIYQLNAQKTIKSNIKLNYFPLLPINKMIETIIDLAKSSKIVISLNELQIGLIKDGFKDLNQNMADYLEISSCEISDGFNYNEYMFLTAKELFGVKIVKSRFENKFKDAIVLNSYQDLKKDDYVVHNQYGIGQYEGIITKEIQNKERDYLQIKYRDGDMLLVPLEQFKLVRKYVGSEGVGIRLSKLGSNSWNKTKERIANEVNDIAGRLIKLYSERENDIGFAFSKDDEYMRRFEENFPYELTKDQKKAISEVKYDMERPKPMDRLLCGDVGFGKTEVAMVGAFKAINDLKQVAYLCPTTILSRQHYNTFVERFKGFPVRIALLNRFVVESQQKQILKDLKEGKIDILIGTHRILSDDVKFSDLGFLIIDEEQRFGVQAKEKIKEMKKTIDVLSLSATPIPRTLQMSLVGVMELSQLETPPQNRMPIQTYVVEKNNNLIKEVIQRELARNGQVFYLHNNISDIYDVARKVKMMVPNASIAIGHGKMTREEIEDVMYRFVEGEYNVLICTTIIETGIDIPNANTILIDNAENLGLSQLYQIRGRVGRSDRLAFAYLLISQTRQLSEVASRRLEAIKDFTELGSGFKVAMRDLTIRGAGELLGDKQAGFMNTIGMSLYLDMLNEAIKTQKGIATSIIETNNIKVNDIDGYIPREFVPQDNEKITIYQKLDTINSLAELESYNEEIKDFYGKLPTSINGLFEKKKMEIMLNNKKIERYDQFEKEVKLILTKEFSDNVDGVALFSNINEISNEIKLRYIQGKIIISLAKRKNYQNKILKVLEVIDKL